MNISSINIYPVKSLGLIELDKINAKSRGLEFDRRWMLIDKYGRFVSQREIPEMCLVDCGLVKEGISIQYNNKDILIPFDLYDERMVSVSVWGSEFNANLVHDKLDIWFSEALGQDLRLVKMTDQVYREKTLIKAPFKSTVSFADGYPILVLGTASMDYLNNQLDEKININRFRANIIVDTKIEHEEDNWETFSIGSASFLNIKPCGRCSMTTIEQETASQGHEPLKTLSKYRKFGNQINFGTNIITTNEGIISKGDKIKFN